MRRICLQLCWTTLLCVLFPGLAKAASLDLKDAVIVASPSASVTVRKAAETLTDEIFERTQARLKISTQWRTDQKPAILLGTSAQIAELAGNLSARLVAAPD
ncbi:MAG TPA: hypothetical protein PLM33_07575, partial [Acidobacteriota bacterium]|nr:hypothetical protein [Acidobacteriota bacterium]